MDRFKPGEDVESLRLNLINGTAWALEDQKHDWNIIVVYRGLHCPVCKSQLQGLKGQIDAFAEADIGVVAVSMDTFEKANQSHKDWSLDSLPIGYELTRDVAESFGLYLSDAINDEEPDLFTEPAILLFRKTVFQAGWIQTIPFARPQFEDVLKGVKFMQDKDYPPRGTLG